MGGVAWKHSSSCDLCGARVLVLRIISEGKTLHQRWWQRQRRSVEMTMMVVFTTREPPPYLQNAFPMSEHRAYQPKA